MSNWDLSRTQSLHLMIECGDELHKSRHLQIAQQWTDSPISSGSPAEIHTTDIKSRDERAPDVVDPNPTAMVATMVEDHHRRSWMQQRFATLKLAFKCSPAARDIMEVSTWTSRSAKVLRSLYKHTLQTQHLGMERLCRCCSWTCTSAC